MKTTTFTAIDFETATPKRWSICQVGIVRVTNGKITEKIDLLVQPPKNEYSNFNIAIHGITPDMTATALTFDKAWSRIKSLISKQNVVAHNGHRFDFNCLKQTLEFYDLAEPKYNKHCTYQIFDAKLDLLCKKYKIKLEKHHNALADATACAELFLLHLKNGLN
ncbi:exonuclease [Niastella koreensis]|uniref:Exonuclease RNase T and DNA polymerase III n=2 Tax=Niastella koreensis TaxID=354356 RepID=G8TQ50_NIAKG|nr:exonuclease domain-containing protein [Niastella koreensis]AEW01051.1 Exonuclease RNase T and DNA polymerase III [Niastella koreensis GR20-10]OQP42655.1 exonuclease [Niastella koreensis]